MYDYLFKIIIVGESGVGKSAILERFVDNRFTKDQEPTIGVEFGASYLQLGNATIKLQIWDTAGQETFYAITRRYYNTAIGALLVYDISSRESFKNVIKWLQDVKKHSRTQHLSIILIGNKLDTKKRNVSTKEGNDLAKEHQMLFLEISAKTGQKVKEAFYTLSESIYNLIPTMSSIDDEIGIIPGILQLEGPYEEIPLGKNSEILQGLGPKKLTDSACCVVS